MKKLLLMLGLIATFIMPVSANAETKTMNSLYAVAFHADWCGSCKILGPNVVKARGKADLDNKNILFVKLDLTSATTRNQSALMAQALGISDFYKSNSGKTGFVLLVNSENGEILEKVTKDMDSGQIISTIEENAKAI